MQRGLLFITMSVAAGLGGAVGSMLGHAAGRGGLIVGGVGGGLALVVVAGFLAVRLGWIDRPRRLWTVLGGAFGFLLAVLVALSTLSSPVGPALSTVLVGLGAVLGATVGPSAHEKA
ncbi:MAG TPA: hypothetical protein VKH19_10100 [Gemmatimonadaceae bacterium]|nr:hypothetical protein [Gemmatimonadaceae bacterium]